MRGPTKPTKRQSHAKIQDNDKNVEKRYLFTVDVDKKISSKKIRNSNIDIDGNDMTARE